MLWRVNLREVANDCECVCVCLYLPVEMCVKLCRFAKPTHSQVNWMSDRNQLLWKIVCMCEFILLVWICMRVCVCLFARSCACVWLYLTDFNTFRAKIVGKCVNYLLITWMNLWLLYLLIIRTQAQQHTHTHMLTFAHSCAQ